MWDTIETTSSHLSHDMPCVACGHATHRHLACSDTCSCVPSPLPGERDTPRQLVSVG